MEGCVAYVEAIMEEEENLVSLGRGRIYFPWLRNRSSEVGRVWYCECSSVE